jgi:hypothetical protein
MAIKTIKNEQTANVRNMMGHVGVNAETVEASARGAVRDKVWAKGIFHADVCAADGTLHTHRLNIAKVAPEHTGTLPADRLASLTKLHEQVEAPNKQAATADRLGKLSVLASLLDKGGNAKIEGFKSIF